VTPVEIDTANLALVFRVLRTPVCSSLNWHFSAILIAFVCLAGLTSAQAQSSCASDATQPPRVVLERFINADCATCWADPATPKAPQLGVALDWIVPGAKGDEAPLSAAASRDALPRLEALGLPVPAASSSHQSLVARAAPRGLSLRVALGGYMGASIELSLRGKPPAGQRQIAYPLTAWLLLAEALPAGAEGSPVPRLLVRNVLQVSWKERNQLSNLERPDSAPRFRESRPMSLPEGSNPDQLRAIGWVQDVTGRVIASAASVCH
jgi:hypothetical protein